MTDPTPTRPVSEADSQATLPPLDADGAATLPPTLADGTPPADAPVDGVRYRVLRSHARGGLGEVFVALDTEVGREVALKEIQGEFADDPASQGRFLREAEVNGRLEHPSIVPVYGLGRHADGRPYYAMRFIRGETLDAAARRFHEADRPGRDPGERALEFRQLLTRFIAVCNAVAYAHSRGVLHRDIKPANVMLGQVRRDAAGGLGPGQGDGPGGERAAGRTSRRWGRPGTVWGTRSRARCWARRRSWRRNRRRAGWTRSARPATSTAWGRRSTCC